MDPQSTSAIKARAEASLNDLPENGKIAMAELRLWSRVLRASSKLDASNVTASLAAMKSGLAEIEALNAREPGVTDAGLKLAVGRCAAVARSLAKELEGAAGG